MVINTIQLKNFGLLEVGKKRKTGDCRAVMFSPRFAVHVEAKMRERQSTEKIEAKAKAKFSGMTDAQRIDTARRFAAGIRQPQMRAAVLKMTLRECCMLALESMERNGYIASV